MRLGIWIPHKLCQPALSLGERLGQQIGGDLALTFLQPLSFTLSWKKLLGFVQFIPRLPQSTAPFPAKMRVAVSYRFLSRARSVLQRALPPAFSILELCYV